MPPQGIESSKFLLAFFTFVCLVQGHLMALNNFSFYLFLDFRESHQSYLKAPNHVRFNSLLYIRESGIAQAFFYSFTHLLMLEVCCLGRL